jgi:hypothetical protein
LGQYPAGFALEYVPGKLLVAGNATATANNIAAHELLFRLGIAANLICQTLFIFVALALYNLLKGVNQRHAVAMVILLVVSVPIAFLTNLHRGGIHVAEVFWGLWLFPLGMLVYRLGFLARILGVLLMAACFAYLANSFTRLRPQGTHMLSTNGKSTDVCGAVVHPVASDRKPEATGGSNPLVSCCLGALAGFDQIRRLAPNFRIGGH